jgi:hypothetical protein
VQWSGFSDLLESATNGVGKSVAANLAQDTTADVSVILTMAATTATDHIILDNYLMEAYPK